MEAIHNTIDTIQSTREMAEYLMLANYAMKPNGVMSQKRLDGPVPKGLLGQENPDQANIQKWLQGEAADVLMDQMSDMVELPPEGFLNKMAGEYANHMKAEQQKKDPEAVQVAPLGFHAPGKSPITAMPGILQDPQPPVLRPMQDWEQNN